MSVKALLQNVARLKARAAELRAALTMRQTVTEYAAERMAEFDKNEFFRRSPAEHKAQVKADIEQERRAMLDVAAGHLVFELEREWPALDAEVRALRQHTMRVAEPVDAYLQRSAGHRLGLTDETEQLIRLNDRIERLCLASESRTWQPSRASEEYARAITSGNDSAIRYIEDIHGRGWAGMQPTSDEEVQAAVSLRALIAQTQAARVPRELDEAAQTIEEISRLVGKATQQKLHNVIAVNLTQRPDLAPQWEAAREELEAAARETAGREQRESAAS